MPPFPFKNPQHNVHRNNNNSSNTRLSTLNTSTIFLLGLKNRENIKLKQQVLQQQTTKLKALEEKTNNANFWQDSQNSSKILKKINQIKSKIEFYKKIENNLNSVIEKNSL